MAAPAEPAKATDRIGSRTGSAPPPATRAPTSATPASAQKAIAPDASSLQAATAVSAPKRRYLVKEYPPTAATWSARWSGRDRRDRRSASAGDLARARMHPA